MKKSNILRAAAVICTACTLLSAASCDLYDKVSSGIDQMNDGETGAHTTGTVGDTDPGLTVDDIKISELPLKMKYNIGDPLDTEGLSLTVTYSDGSRKTVSSGFTCEPETLESIGNQLVTVTYENKSATFNVSVKNLTLTGISVDKLPDKTVYTVGDELDTAGLVVSAAYSNGKTEVLDGGYECLPTGFGNAGTQTVTVNYSGFTATFEVEVKTDEKEVSYFTIKTPPKKTVYTKGERLAASGLSLAVTYADGSTGVVTYGYSCSPTTLNTTGNQKITVYYGGRSASFNVTVNEPAPAVAPDAVAAVWLTAAPTKLNYEVGDAFDPTGMALGFRYGNGTVSGTSSGYTYSPQTFTAAGIQNVKVYYGGQMTTVTVTVKEPRVPDRLVVASKPIKTEYYYGESLDLTGIMVKAQYADGTMETLSNSEFTCTPGVLDEIGRVLITVHYGDVTGSFYVTVRGKTS